jgi:hypothetical protein
MFCFKLAGVWRIRIERKLGPHGPAYPGPGGASACSVEERVMDGRMNGCLLEVIGDGGVRRPVEVCHGR